MMKNQTNFIDLCVDCQTLILEHLDFDGLVKIAQINIHFSILAANVFRQKYSKIKIIFEDIEYCDKPSTWEQETGIFSTILNTIRMKQKPIDHSYCDFDDYFEIHQYDVMLNVLKYFGHVISKLNINYLDLKDDEAKTIAKYIDKYSSNYLTAIEFNSHNQNVPKYLTNPLKNVENVSMIVSLVERIEGSLPINELFPALRYLTLGNFGYIDESIVLNFPHLEHLNLFGDFLSFGIIDGDINIIEMIKKNAQIQSIELNNIKPKFLKTIINLMPNLKVLILSRLRNENMEIRSESITNLQIIEDVKEPENLILPNLKDLWINYQPEEIDSWIKFMEKHNSLERFHLQSIYFIDELFERLTYLLDVREMSVAILEENFLDTTTIINFITSHRNLQKFSLNMCSERNKQILKSKFEHEWIVTDFQKCLVFRRENLYQVL